MSKRKRRRERRIRVRGVRRSKPDLRKLGSAVLMYAEAQAEKEAMEDHKRRTHPKPRQHK